MDLTAFLDILGGRDRAPEYVLKEKKENMSEKSLFRKEIEKFGSSSRAACFKRREEKKIFNPSVPKDWGGVQ